MEKVLVTGGAGYLGCVLVPYLLECGYAVRVLDRFQHRNPGLLACMKYANFEAVKGDCRDTEILNKVKKGVNWVIPLAAIVGAPACDDDKELASATNWKAIQKLMTCLHKDVRVLYPNTNSGYGSSNEVCTEDTPLHPISHYGRIKMWAEECVLNYPNTLSFRFATVFGLSPRMRLDLLVNDFVWRAVKDKAITIFEGTFKRNFIHIHDVAWAFLHAMKNFETMKGKVYNVGDRSCSKWQLCDLIQKQVSAFHIVEGETDKDPDQRNYIVSTERIRATGFLEFASLERGIEELVEGYKMFPTQEFRNA